MDRNVSASAPDRPGKTSVWMTFRSAGKYDAPESQPTTTQPPHVGVGSLDNVRSVFWQAYRHLFPPHSLAAQTPNGNVVISWSIMRTDGCWRTAGRLTLSCPASPRR